MRVDRRGGFRALGQVFAHADLVRCTWSLRLYRYKKRRGIKGTAECGFNLGTREGTRHATILDFLCKVINNFVHKRDARRMVWDNSSASQYRHGTNRETCKKITDKGRIEMKNIMSAEEVIEGFRQIRRSNFIKNMRIGVKSRIKNAAQNRRRKVCICQYFLRM